jgi:hypothetical protein
MQAVPKTESKMPMLHTINNYTKFSDQGDIISILKYEFPYL